MAQQSTTFSFPSWWLPDDTEESVVGAEWHQFAINSLVSGLRELAARDYPDWHVGNQLTLIGPHPSGQRLWHPKPDALIHRTAGPSLREDLDTQQEGLPTLLIEVLSPSTRVYDLSLRGPESGRPGKAWSYLEFWGVAEYLTFDPLEEFVPGQMRAWRHEEGRTVGWEAGPSGRYTSMLGVSFAPEGPLLRVYDAQGQPMLFETEQAALLVQRNRELAQRDHELAQRDHDLVQHIQALAEERQARQQLEQRLQELEAQLQYLRGEE